MKRRLVGAVLGPVMAVLVVATPPVAAQGAPKPPIDEQIRSARRAALEASAEEERLLEQIQASAARKRDLDAKVSALEKEVSAAQREVDAAQAKLSGLEVQERAAESRLSETMAALAVAKDQLARQAIAAYTGRTEAASYVDVALRSHDMAELVAKRAYIKAVAGSQSETVATTERLRDQVRDLRDRVERSRVAAQGQRDVVAAQRNRVQSQRSAQAGAASEVAAEIDRSEKLKGEAVARKAEFEAKADALQGESDAIAATLRQRAASQAAARQNPAAAPAGGGGRAAPAGGQAAAPARTGRLAHPVPGAPVTSGFGYRIHPIYGTSRLHAGVDFGAATGTAIRAAESGTVVSAGSQSGYGNATVIDHGNGLATLYGHQSSIGVSSGQTVTRGQVIGRVGCTGACTGPHLHFEVRRNGTPVDPMGYL
ncbi:MAG TPA: peptidoglycan DD-metalloendopeptidase family protein [Acidimicrobiales bacterium]|nr:peptidoglycan DD-metalloendopeptidase family protein [Acidimicrobiales bacterium]